MSDKEVKERIEKDADKYVKRQGTHDRPDITKHDYIQGATAERPKAWNDALHAAISDFDMVGGSWSSSQIIDRLEKLKHKQP